MNDYTIHAEPHHAPYLVPDIYSDCYPPHPDMEHEPIRILEVPNVMGRLDFGGPGLKVTTSVRLTGLLADGVWYGMTFRVDERGAIQQALELAKDEALRESWDRFDARVSEALDARKPATQRGQRAWLETSSGMSEGRRFATDRPGRLRSRSVHRSPSVRAARSRS